MEWPYVLLWVCALLVVWIAWNMLTVLDYTCFLESAGTIKVYINLRHCKSGMLDFPSNFVEDIEPQNGKGEHKL